jgi:hypothetical protein
MFDTLIGPFNNAIYASVSAHCAIIRTNTLKGNICLIEREITGQKETERNLARIISLSIQIQWNMFTDRLQILYKVISTS